MLLNFLSNINLGLTKRNKATYNNSAISTKDKRLF